MLYHRVCLPAFYELDSSRMDVKYVCMLMKYALLQLLVPRPQRGRFAPRPQYASNGPGWGGEGYPMQAYPPPGKIIHTHLHTTCTLHNEFAANR